MARSSITTGVPAVQTIQAGRGGLLHVISPLAGEMSGRTEGGVTANATPPISPLSHVMTVGASRPVRFLISAIASAAAMRSASASWVSMPWRAGSAS